MPPAAAAAIAGAVVRLAHDDGLRDRLGRAARRHVTEHYPLDRAAAMIEHLYLDVLGLETADA